MKILLALIMFSVSTTASAWCYKVYDQSNRLRFSQPYPPVPMDRVSLQDAVNEKTPGGHLISMPDQCYTILDILSDDSLRQHDEEIRQHDEEIRQLREQQIKEAQENSKRDAERKIQAVRMAQLEAESREAAKQKQLSEELKEARANAHSVAALSEEDKQRHIKNAMAAVRANLLDPASANFRNLIVFMDDEKEFLYVCGSVNSKNKMGGYAGWKPFYASAYEQSDSATIWDDTTSEGFHWQKNIRKRCD